MERGGGTERGWVQRIWSRLCVDMQLHVYAHTHACFFKEMVHNFFIFWKELWPKPFETLAFVAEVLVKDS